MLTALRNLPLSVRLPLLGAAMVVLVGAVASQQVLLALGRVQDARLRELAALHVEGLSVALGPLVLRRDIWEIYDTLQRAAQASQGRRVVLTAVAGEDGRVLAATDPRRVPVDSAIRQLAEEAVPLEQLSAGVSETIVRVVAPLSYQGRDVGRIVTELDVSDLQAERRRALWFLLAGNALATGVLAGLGYLGMRRMLRPVSTLARHMTGVEGKPEPIDAAEMPQGEGELARLARIYNDMVAEMAEKSQIERRLAERERLVALGRLSSSLAHEINNPLGGLLNAADTLRSYPDRPGVVRQSAELLERGLRHLRDVTRVTLEQNRLERVDRPLVAEDLEDIRLLIAPEMRRRDQRLRWSVARDALAEAHLPAAPIRQIMLNLLLNASTAAGKGGQIGFRARAEKGLLRLEFLDDGPGMSEAARVRLLSDASVPAGGGVGLRLVRDLLRGLGGDVALGREDGMTRIRVTLDAARKDRDA